MKYLQKTLFGLIYHKTQSSDVEKNSSTSFQAQNWSASKIFSKDAALQIENNID